MVCLSRPYSFKCLKGCLPQILLGPFLNTLPHFISKITDNYLELEPICISYEIWIVYQKYVSPFTWKFFSDTFSKRRIICPKFKIYLLKSEVFYLFLQIFDKTGALKWRPKRHRDVRTSQICLENIARR